MNPYEIIDAWHERVHSALNDALAYLASLEAAPVSDGILIEWIDVLVALRFAGNDVPLIVQLIDKTDPHLQEAGVRLARAALRSVTAASELEPALARLASREIDAWVLEALVDLLAEDHGDMTTVYQGLAAIHGKQARGWGIKRNRGIQPWRRLVQVYLQHAIQSVRPRPRDLAYLPVLERELGTHGWEVTQRHILTTMGFDPDEHLRLLRGDR
ncbi:MAG TPA: hypothetical protein VIV11_34075 [Kofleriaceae bacterium]